MKTSIPFRFILGAAVLAYALMGECSLHSASAQTRSDAPPSTNLIATSPDNASAASALTPEIDPNSPLGQIISLVQAGVEQSVILNYVSNSSSLFNLDADKIIYLNDLGVPTEIINAMMQHDQQLEGAGAAPPPPAQSESVYTTETVPQPAEVTVNYFYDTLAPYGSWLNVAGYGWCWRPTVEVYDTGWQPYCNNGHWLYTDHGWYWMSGYSWGWATFHYGRWFRIPRYGWCWWPDTTWAPSWVCWRYDGNYCGWAPLPPHAIYRSGIGFFYNGHPVSAGFSFGLSASAFTFVPTRNFCDLQPWRHRIGEKEAMRIYHRSRAFHNMDFDRRDQAIVNSGIPPHDITAVTKRPIHPVSVHYQTGGLVRGNRHEQFEHGGRTLVVNRPHFVGSQVLTLPRGASPTTEHRQNEFHPIVHGNANKVFQQTSQPALNNYQRRDLNQTSYRNYNHGMVRTPQTKPANPPRQNEFQLNVYQRDSGASSHSRNSDRHNARHPEVNQSQSRRFNQAQPQTPQHRQSESPHVITPGSQRPNTTGETPRSSQNRPTYRNSQSQYRVVSPRSRGFEQQAPHSIFPATPQQSAAADRQREQHFSAPMRRFAAPSGQQQNQRHYGAPRNASRNNAQHISRAPSQPHVIRPQSTPDASSASPHHFGGQARDNNNGQRGH